MAVDHRPEAVGFGVVGGAFVHEDGAAEGVIADQGPWAHHPADVGDPEEAVGGFQIEAEVEFLRALHLDAGVGVDDAFGLAGGSRRVEEHRLLAGIQFLRLVVVGL